MSEKNWTEIKILLQKKKSPQTRRTDEEGRGGNEEERDWIARSKGGIRVIKTHAARHNTDTRTHRQRKDTNGGKKKQESEKCKDEEESKKKEKKKQIRAQRAEMRKKMKQGEMEIAFPSSGPPREQ